jgi:hypothetical protein
MEKKHPYIQRKIGFLLIDDAGITVQSNLKNCFIRTSDSTLSCINKPFVSQEIEAMLLNLQSTSNPESEYNIFYQNLSGLDEKDYGLETVGREETKTFIQKFKGELDKAAIPRDLYELFMNLVLFHNGLSIFKEDWYADPHLFFSDDFFNQIRFHSPTSSHMFENIDLLEVCDFIEVNDYSLYGYYHIPEPDSRKILEELELNKIEGYDLQLKYFEKIHSANGPSKHLLLVNEY